MHLALLLPHAAGMSPVQARLFVGGGKRKMFGGFCIVFYKTRGLWVLFFFSSFKHNLVILIVVQGSVT